MAAVLTAPVLSASSANTAANTAALDADKDAGNRLADRNDPHGGMLRFPDVSADSIVFVYANDLWVVGRDGGVARPLASPPGAEASPKFSPDGSMIAFVGNYDGDRDIYVMDAFGGVPSRITYHPSNELLNDWVDGDTLLMAANGYGEQVSYTQTRQLYTIDLDAAETGGVEMAAMPTKLPVPYGASASLSPDGKTLAYTPHSRDNRTWKRYRGGMATNIWMFDTQTKESSLATEWEGTDTAPMLFGEKLYYLSDEAEGGRLNLFEYDPASGDRRQLTDARDFDVKFPSIGPGPDGNGEIIYQLGADLYLVGLAEGATPQQVKVQIPGAKPALRPQKVDTADFVGAGGISPTGKRVVVEARGDIYTVPAEQGVPRHLVDSDGAADRNPAWSPNGKWVAYSSDKDGEYNVYLTQSDGKQTVNDGKPIKITDIDGRFWTQFQWSPDSSKILAKDQTGAHTLIRLEEDEEGNVISDVLEFDRDPTGFYGGESWSHDSRWIAYARGHDDAYMASIFVYDTEADDAEPVQVTDTMFNASSPAFDRQGKFLYYVTAMDFGGPDYDFAGSTFVYDDIERIVAVPLTQDVKSPMLLEADEEEIVEEEEEVEEGEEGDASTQPSTQPDEEAASGEEGGEEDAAEDAEDEEEESKYNLESPLHGEWSGTLSGLAAMGVPEDDVTFTMKIFANADGSFTGSQSAMGQTMSLDTITFEGEEPTEFELIPKRVCDSDRIIEITGAVDGASE
ncbi:MAG: hypothetical protein AAGK78_02535, partial [Planctomycetota bacterium]